MKTGLGCTATTPFMLLASALAAREGRGARPRAVRVVCCRDQSGERADLLCTTTVLGTAFKRAHGRPTTDR